MNKKQPRLTIKAIGTGTWEIDPEGRGNACFLIYDNKTGKRFLFDCGSGTKARLGEAGLRPGDIAHIAITHRHADHISGLYEWLLSHHASPGKLSEINIWAPEDANHLRLREYYDQMADMHGSGDLPTNHLFFYDCQPETLLFEEGDINITSFPVRHAKNMASCGYRLEAGDKTIVYTGDVASPLIDQPKGFWQGIANANGLITEMGNGLAHTPESSHICLQQAAEMAQQAQADQLLLFHCPYSQLAAAQKRQNPPQLQVLTDGQEVYL